MPVFNGGASQASVRSAVEQLTAAQSALDEQALIVREKISSAWAEWSMARQRADLSEKQAAFSSTLVDSYRAQFRLARRSLLELLNVQNETFGYQSALIQARFDIRFAELKLLNSLGQLANKINSTPD
jgi:outer membrane protein TolC